MTNDTENLIHKVIDDLATAEECQVLAKTVREDETTAAAFEQIKQLTATLATVPALAVPPELHAVVMSQIEKANTSQLFRDPSVFVAPRAQSQNNKPASTSQIIFSRMETVMSEIKKGFFSSTMNKVLVGGGVAAATLIAITAGGNFPSTNQDTVGTIAPAQRYRSDQNVTADVRPSAGGGAGSAQLPGTDGAAAKSANNSADKSAQASAEKAANKSAEASAEKAANKAAEASAEKAANKSAEASAEKAANKSAEASAEKAANKSAEASAEKAANKAANKSAEASAEKAANKSAEASAEKAANKAANKSAEASAEKAANKSAQQSAEKSAQQSAEKMLNQ